MDTSQKYIFQCEEAEEIQALRPSGADEHDYFYCKVHGLGCDLDNAVWLPLQAQLQEMVRERAEEVKNNEGLIWTLLLVIQSWSWQNWHYAKTFTSMEQLWLAAVMDWKFNKKWNGIDWIKEF